MKKREAEVPAEGGQGQGSRLGPTPSQGARKISPRSQPGAWGAETSDQSLS